MCNSLNCSWINFCTAISSIVFLLTEGSCYGLFQRQAFNWQGPGQTGQVPVVNFADEKRLLDGKRP